MSDAFKVGFVTGTTPDKWARTWRERFPNRPLQLLPLDGTRAEHELRDGALDMCLARLPIERDGVHCIPLYDEVQVVVAAADHFVAAGDEVTLADLIEEQLVAPHYSGWTPQAQQLEWPPMTAREAIETVAAGQGVFLTPMSVARLYARRDVVSRLVPELEPTTIGLTWLVDHDDPGIQDFIGIVRGRTANSSRS